MSDNTVERLPTQSTPTHQTTEVAKLLNDPDVAEIMREYPDDVEDITNAAKYLVDNKEDLGNIGPLIKGLTKAAQTIVAKKMKIFVSYKKNEEMAATALASHIESLAGNQVELSYAPKFKVGIKWTSKIHAAVRSANWFILLLPDRSSTSTWDWVLYETGMFRGQMAPGDRLICIHRPAAQQPDQIREFEGLSGEYENIKKELLEPLLTLPNAVPGMPAINPNVHDNILENSAIEISAAILSYEGEEEEWIRHRFEAFVRIHLDMPKTKMERRSLRLDEIEDALQKAKIKRRSERDTGTNSRSLAIFGWESQPDTWGQLVSDVLEQGTDSRWHDELCRSLKQAAGGQKFEPVQATLSALDEGKSVYRPVLYASEVLLSGVLDAILIVFVKEAGALKIGKELLGVHVDGYPKEGYLQLASSIRLSYRFRWEVVEPFKNIKSEKQIPELIDACERVMQDAASRGQHRLEDLAPIFELEGQKAEVEKLYREFENVRNKLQKEIEKNDVEEIRKILANFAPVNQRYLTLSSQLFGTMNEKLLNAM